MRNDLIVEKILLLIERIEGFCKSVDYANFSNNDMLIDACVFNLSQIGEQVNKIDEDFEMAHPEVPWRQVYGLRNRIVHDYEGVNLKLIWEIIESDLPTLKDELLKL